MLMIGPSAGKKIGRTNNSNTPPSPIQAQSLIVCHNVSSHVQPPLCPFSFTVSVSIVNGSILAIVSFADGPNGLIPRYAIVSLPYILFCSSRKTSNDRAAEHPYRELHSSIIISRRRFIAFLSATSTAFFLCWFFL